MVALADVPLVVLNVTQLPPSTWYCQLSQFTFAVALRLMLELLAAEAEAETAGAALSICGRLIVALVVVHQFPLVLARQKILKLL